LLAGAENWVVLINVLLEKLCLVELSQNVEGGSNEGVDVFESIEESASQSIQTKDLVVGQEVDEVGEDDVDGECA